jgi:NTE family protein
MYGTDKMNSTASFPKGEHIQRIALVLQGGGALGAYQAGVYQALHEKGFAPDWVAGTSIGAVNAALIAGNPPERRLDRLREFWHAVSRADLWDVSRLPKELRQAYDASGVAATVWCGQPGMFTPRILNPALGFLAGAAEYASYYDTSPLRDTLLSLVDFDCLNQHYTRLSLGAVHVKTGTPRYFDSLFQRIGPEHIMASGALPPGFPPVPVEGELYWDGGIVSNTPLEVVLDDVPRVNTLCFMVDLFNPIGPAPTSLPEVYARHKDIAYANRSERGIREYQEKHNLRRAVRALYKALPESKRNDPELKELAELGCRTTMEVVHLSYRGKPWETATRDADFSAVAIAERWDQGYQDAVLALKQEAWMMPVPPHVGVVVYEQDLDVQT